MGSVLRSDEASSDGCSHGEASTHWRERDGWERFREIEQYGTLTRRMNIQMVMVRVWRSHVGRWLMETGRRAPVGVDGVQSIVIRQRRALTRLKRISVENVPSC